MSLIHDVIGVGAGPANLAIAAALEDGKVPLRRLFLEAQPESRWHAGMLMPGSRLQTIMHEDVATYRDPTSRFSFLNYLKQAGRLVESLALHNLFPTRLEFSDYLTWVGQQLGDSLRYGQRVTGIEPTRDPDGRIRALDVHTLDQTSSARRTYSTRSLVLAPGGRKWLPDGVRSQPAGRVFHSSEFAQRIRGQFPDRNARHHFIIVGAGQSGAEIFLHLMTEYPNAQVTATFRGVAYRPMDDTPSNANTVFHPQGTDFFFGLPVDQRPRMRAMTSTTNYGVVDQDLIERIYEELYRQKVAGRERGSVRTLLQLEQAYDNADAARAEFINLSDGGRVTMDADAVICATGFTCNTRHPLLDGLEPHLELDEGGGYRVRRDYSLRSAAEFEARVYVPGLSETTHGPAEPLLCQVAVRAEQVVAALVASSSPSRTALAPAGSVASALGAQEPGPMPPAEVTRQRLAKHLLQSAYGIECQPVLPGPPDVDAPFGMDWAVIKPQGSTQAHHHADHEMFLVLEGTGDVEIAGSRVTVNAGDVVHVPATREHQVFNTSEGHELSFVSLWWDEQPEVASAEHSETDEAKLGRPLAPKVLVTAAPPTPDGNIHLGHLSGPYLAGDVLTRHLRRCGAHVDYVSGTDDNQSYVPVEGESIGLTPEATAELYAESIESTFVKAGVELDLFVRPNATTVHTSTVLEFLGDLFRRGKLLKKETEAAFCEPCDTFLFEAHVRGLCPHCRAPSRGSYCENCGLVNECVDLLEPGCAHCGETPTTRTCERLFFPLEGYRADLLRFHAGCAMNDNLRAFLARVLQQPLPDIAVSHPAEWGIPAWVPGISGQRLFAWFEMAPRYLAYGEALSQDPQGSGWADVWKASDRSVVQCFGSDNAFFYSVLIPALYCAYDRDIKLPTAFVMNEFYQLDGSKFSTSRNHAVWAADLLEIVPADCVRFHLAKTRPELERTSFSLVDLQQTLEELPNVWGTWLCGLIGRVTDDYDAAVPPTRTWTKAHREFHALLLGVLAEAERHYRVEHFSTQAVVRSMETLVHAATAFAATNCGPDARGSGTRQSAVALELLAAKILALVAYPVMPTFAANVFIHLGFKVAVASYRWDNGRSWVPVGQHVQTIDDFDALIPGATRAAAALQRASMTVVKDVPWDRDEAGHGQAQGSIG